MRARVAVVLALLACSCAPARERQFAETFDRAQQALRRGEFSDAIKLTNARLGNAAPDSTDPWVWRLRLLAAEAAIFSRDFAAAEPAIGAPLPQGPAFDPLRARQKYLRVRLNVSKNDLRGALPLLAEGRALAGGDRSVRLDIDHLDGQVRMRLGKWGEADALLNGVVDDAGASDPFHQAEALNDLGMGRFVRSQWDQALPYFERVIALDAAREFSIYASSLGNAGSCYQRLGQFDRAMAVQQRALEMQEHRGTRENFAVALFEMGNLYVLRGTPADGLPFYKRALAVASAANVTARAAVAAGNLAEAESQVGNWDEAQRYNDESKRLKALVPGQKLVYNTLVSAAIALGRERFDEARRLYEDALADPGADASIRWGAHGGLATVARRQRQPDVAARHFEAALDIVEKTRSDLLKTEYKLAYLTQLIEFYRDYVDLLIEQGRIERALEVADSSRGQVLAERQHVAAPARGDITAIARLGKDRGSIFLSYWLTRSQSYLWIVDRGGVKLVKLPRAAEIESLVREQRETIANALADPLAAKGSAGDRLYQLLIAPAAPSLQPGATVVIVPDGALYGLNFETLPVDAPRRHYWIEDAEVQVAPSLAVLMAGASRGISDRNMTALVIGDPLPRPPEYPALKFAAAEMSAIEQRLKSAGRVMTISRDAATPAAYRAARPETFALVHFAAHAAANVDSPLDSAVILSGTDTAYKLYARDVAAEKLTADLVTVSACRSAGERAYSGEGLIGFAWAFLRAGARRVVAGLWDVDDRSTAELMDRMYERLASGAQPARALREAKLAAIRQPGRAASPYAWGAFELFTVVP